MKKRKDAPLEERVSDETGEDQIHEHFECPEIGRRQLREALEFIAQRESSWRLIRSAVVNSLSSHAGDAPNRGAPTVARPRWFVLSTIAQS